jgi:hypothetical protein
MKKLKQNAQEEKLINACTMSRFNAELRRQAEVQTIRELNKEKRG